MSEDWWGGSESLIRIFISAVAQGNEDTEPAHPLPLFSFFQESFTITKVMEEIFKVNANEDIGDMDLWDFTQDTYSTLVPVQKPPVASIILTVPPEVHSSTPPSSKQKPSPKEESNSKTITSRSTNPTPVSSQTTATHTISCDTEMQKTPPNYKIYKLISKSLPSLLMPLSLKPPTHQRPPQKTRMLSLTFPTIFPRTVAELLGINLQKLRDTTIPITF